MGIFSSGASAIPASITGDEAGHLGRVLFQQRIQPQICDSVAERSTPREEAATEATTIGELWSGTDTAVSGGLGSGGLSLVGSLEGGAAIVAALDSKTISFGCGNGEEKLLRISAATMDRHLKSKKESLIKRHYGGTKPGTLLKHHIPIKTDSWNVKEAGFVEVDLVSHSGNCGDGEFIHSLNMTDIHTGWVETRAVLGKGQAGIVAAMEQMRQSLPFPLRGIDSDNGSEFINYHLKSYCSRRRIQFTRGRPYKKDDNAHIEQKNWTHVRKIFGYLRLDSPAVLATMNDLYVAELRVYQNLFQPSTKLLRKTRVGSRLRRVYEPPKTPLERVRECGQADGVKLAQLDQTFQTHDPFELSKKIDQKLEAIFQLANARMSPRSGHSSRE